MAKEKLSGGNGKQFSVDCGKPSKRFYLGHDEAAAQVRKQKLLALWRCANAAGDQDWGREGGFLLEAAEAIRKGEEKIVVRHNGEPWPTYRAAIQALNSLP